jgi:hypothetical protein
MKRKILEKNSENHFRKMFRKYALHPVINVVGATSAVSELVSKTIKFTIRNLF